MPPDFGAIFCIGANGEECGKRLKRTRKRGAPKKRCAECRAKVAYRPRKPKTSPCAFCGDPVPQKTTRGRSRVYCPPPKNCKNREFLAARALRNSSEMSAGD